jgi:hypothetical protein
MSVGKIKQLAFSEGTSVSAPTSVGSTTIGYEVYANEAAFVSANGAATSGDVFYDSTANAVKVYVNGTWRSEANTTESQTLTNKTLTSPVINTPTGIVKGDVGLGNVDNTSDATKNAASVTLTNKTLTSPILNSPTVGTNLDMLAGAETRYYDADASNYVGFKAPALAANKIWTLPTADGTAGQVLSTDASANLSWASVATDSTAQYNVKVGNSGGTAAQANTNLLGDVKAQTLSQTATMTIAAPGVVTSNSHGMALGDKFYFTTTGALPTGVTASTTYYASNIAANTFNISTTLANAKAGTYVTTSGTQSGTHTLVMGGLTLTSGVRGTTTDDNATAGYVGEQIISTVGATSFTTNQTFNATSINLSAAGDYEVSAYAQIVKFTDTFTATDFELGISNVSGDFQTRLVLGDTFLIWADAFPTSFTYAALPFGTIRVTSDGINLAVGNQAEAAGTTLYLKLYINTRSSGTAARYYCTLRARRVR